MLSLLITDSAVIDTVLAMCKNVGSSEVKLPVIFTAIHCPDCVFCHDTPIGPRRDQQPLLPPDHPALLQPGHQEVHHRGVLRPLPRQAQRPRPAPQLGGKHRRFPDDHEATRRIELSPEKKTKVGELLKGLDQKAELTDEEAKEKLDSLLDQVKDQKSTLEAAGYRWPGEGGGGGRGAAPPANPFKEEANSQHLKVLQERLAKGK